MDEIADVLVQEFGFRREARSETENDIRLKGGSQLRTRLLGGYFVSPRYLPSRIQLQRTDDRQMRLVLEDSLGISIRDARLEARYAELAASIQRTIETL